jgi:hypothetical protein
MPRSYKTLYTKPGDTVNDHEFYPSPKNGMPLKYWMTHFGKEFDGRAGLYLISVYLKAYSRFSKVGLATNLKTRFFFYQTAWWPVMAHARIHGVWLKKADRTQKSDWTGSGLPNTILVKAEARIHAEITANGFEMHGEWAQVSVNQMVKWLNLFHFGSLTSTPPEEWDGHGMEAYLFTNTLKMIIIEDTFVSAAELYENRKGDRTRKKSQKQREADGDEPVETPIKPVTDAATVTALQARLALRKK